MGKRIWVLIVFLFILVGCTSASGGQDEPHILDSNVYLDKVHGAWQAIMVANHTGLQYEGDYLDEPSPDEAIELALLEEWSTDDDTAIEWVDLHILETYGVEPTYEQIRDEWVAHLNNDIWNSTLRARQLMDQGVLPPDTGSAELNPVGAWSISAQLETELFGLLAPGMPGEAARRARYFARVTNSGPAVDASAFYAAMYALAYFESHVPTIIEAAQGQLSADSEINRIVDQMTLWHGRYPDDWRRTRAMIRDVYDHDPEWWASRVNFASTIMALLYGDGDLMKTMTIACLAGWDADNNATTSAGLIGLIVGFQDLPEPVRTATDVYSNPDVTGGLPQYETVPVIAERTMGVAEEVIRAAGGEVVEDIYRIPASK